MATHHRRGATPSEEGLSPEAQRMLGYLFVGFLALLAIIKILRMLFFSMPLVAVLLFLTKPSPDNFPAFLALVEKKREQEEGQRRTGSDNWLLNAISKGIQKTAEILVPPSHYWLFLDLGLLVLAKKKKASSRSQGEKYAVGALNTWLMIDPAVYGADSIPVRFLDTINSFLTDDKWQSFSALPSSSSGGTVSKTLDVDPTKWLEQFIAGASSGVYAPSPGGTTSGAARTRQEYMEKAQSLAESGRFEQAGKSS